MVVLNHNGLCGLCLPENRYLPETSLRIPSRCLHDIGQVQKKARMLIAYLYVSPHLDNTKTNKWWGWMDLYSNRIIVLP